MTDLLENIFWISVAVFVVSYFFVRPFFFITRESLRRRKRERWVKQRQKKYRIADEIYGDRLRSQHQTIKDQDKIIVDQQNTINFLQSTSPELHDGFTNFDQGWLELQKVPEPSRKGCNHSVRCSILLMDERKDYIISSWHMPRTITPFELGRLYLGLFSGCQSKGYGIGLKMQLEICCDNANCDVKHRYSLEVTAYTPDGSDDPNYLFTIRRCYLRVYGNVPRGHFDGTYLVQEDLRVKKVWSEVREQYNPAFLSRV